MKLHKFPLFVKAEYRYMCIVFYISAPPLDSFHIFSK